MDVPDTAADQAASLREAGLETTIRPVRVDLAVITADLPPAPGAGAQSRDRRELDTDP